MKATDKQIKFINDMNCILHWQLSKIVTSIQASYQIKKMLKTLQAKNDFWKRY